MEQMLIQLLSGGLGGVLSGNIIGGVIKNISLGTVGNTIAGLIGGAGATQLLPMILPLLGMDAGPVVEASGGEAGGFDMNAILAQVGAGAAGGGIITTLLGALRAIFGRR